MKIEKLTDNKIRIILDIDDLIEKNIDVHSLIKNNNSTQKFFKKLLKQAQKEVDFDVENSKLLIEAFISTDGFFVLTFTKLANNAKEKNFSSQKNKKKKTNSPSKHAIYQFDTFDEFCSFCTYLGNSKSRILNKLAKNTSLYEYNSNYFLILSEIDIHSPDVSLFYASISEFAKLASNSQCFSSKIIEYGNAIFKTNAIKNGVKHLAKKL